MLGHARVVAVRWIVMGAVRQAEVDHRRLEGGQVVVDLHRVIGARWASAARYSSEPRSGLLLSPAGDGQDPVPSEYTYSTALVADTDEAQDT